MPTPRIVFKHRRENPGLTFRFYENNSWEARYDEDDFIRPPPGEGSVGFWLCRGGKICGNRKSMAPEWEWKPMADDIQEAWKRHIAKVILGE